MSMILTCFLSCFFFRNIVHGRIRKGSIPKNVQYITKYLQLSQSDAIGNVKNNHVAKCNFQTYNLLN